MNIPDNQNLAITGRTGSGKTYTAKAHVEALLRRKQRVCIIDPTDAWWGLRTSADGKKPGFPVVVFGGDHADVPINAHSGPALAEYVAVQNMPCIIVTADMTIDDRRRFVSEFADTLFRMNRKPITLVLDEADEVAPQNPPPDMKVVLHRIDRIVRRGRIRGFRIIMITQRPAVLHKNVLSQCSTLIAMRLMAPQDRKAIEAWILGQADLEQGKEVLASLPKLKVGEGWLWIADEGAPQRLQFPKIETYDSSRAPTATDLEPDDLKFASVDLDEIKAAFADAELAAEQDDPKQLRQRIKELEAEIEDAVTVSSQKEIERAAIAGYERGYRLGWKALAEKIGPRLRDCDAELISIRSVLGQVEMPEGPLPAGELMTADQLGHAVRREASPVANARPVVRDASLSTVGTALLGVLVSHYPAWLTWQQTATLGGLKAHGPQFFNARAQLRATKMIEESDDEKTLRASTRGLSAAGVDISKSRTLEDVRALWLARLPRQAAQMLKVILDQSPISAHELARKMGKQSYGPQWNNAMSILRGNGLIEGTREWINIAPVLMRPPQ